MTNPIKKEILNDIPKFNEHLGTCAQIPYGEGLFLADYKLSSNGQSYGIHPTLLKSMCVNREFKIKLCYWDDLDLATYDRFKLFKYYGNGNNVEMVRFQAEKLVETKFCGLAKPYYFMVKGRRWYIDQMLSCNDPRGDFLWDDKYSYGDTEEETTEESIKEEVNNGMYEYDKTEEVKELALKLYVDMADLLKKIHNL